MPPMTTNRTWWRVKTPRIGRGSNTTFLADAPCIPHELVDRARCNDGPPQAFFRRQGQRRHELRPIDSPAGDVHYVHLEVARAKNPLQRAVTRVLKTPLDGRDHRLRNPGLRGELALGQPLALSRGSHQSTCLHIWKSISARRTRSQWSPSGKRTCADRSAHVPRCSVGFVQSDLVVVHGEVLVELFA